MRVIAGEFRSRRLKTLPRQTTRPTPDRLRETLFDILAPRIAGVLFIDGYAGTGAVGIEALSRGARRAVFLEKSRAAADVIRENVAALGLERRSVVIPGPVLRSLPNHPGDIVFLDPPYELEGEYRTALELLGANPPPLVIVQHSRRLEFQENYAALCLTRTLRQGDNALSFYERAE